MVTYRYHRGLHEPVRETMPIPAPEANEVRIKILAGGVCGSDVSIFKGTLQPRVDTFTAGHEGAGIIDALGSSVEATYPEFSLGTYVAILGVNPCLQEACVLCSMGRDNLCYTLHMVGLGVDGSWAEYCVVPASTIVAVPGSPSDIAAEVVAVSTDAVLTPYHAMRTIARIQSGQTVLILGCGGLGYNAVQIAKNCCGAGCVVASDVRDTSLRAAVEVGADYAVEPDRLAALIQEHRLSIDVVVDVVGTDASFQTAVSAVAFWGTIVVVGMGSSTMALPILPSALKEVTVKSSFWGCKGELKEVLEAVRGGLVRPHVETRPLSDCGTVLKEMMAGKLKGRVALVPDQQ
ncbi:alcohol dehydogenase [Gloeophyllum trabeum ATCC 11539]|uniref:Alcohol dehydogenase n=1 Tax=Gloeophyllum trabeum (strain ATCC 11539 / FP-39264 / Madison 617) TaxID=670483 RepID=S7Q9T7_GLOTA|nr:alcohol dehydogenase [Gloeophyllum trabeum ATCC 11539]EPQ56681.1 alcohol dehydogenase [Gloeophyllum trabeum ATCC 11539]